MRISPFLKVFTASVLALASVPLSANSGTVPTGARIATTQVRAVGDERECLALAIAYEAGFEPLDGRRAVADVILNRTRSGSHPATVCGVVYEGSARRTGCQFTFTCDGSLSRRLSVRVIDEARQIADEALSGITPSQVGGAINYHADYVNPYWAPSMLRVAKIGRHIFYRPSGSSRAAALRVHVEASRASERTAGLDLPKPAAFAPWGISIVNPQ